jgi:hypothetical protein
MAHRCNCAYCPRRWVPWQMRLATWGVMAALAYWKLYVLVQWLGSLSTRLIGP